MTRPTTAAPADRPTAKSVTIQANASVLVPSGASAPTSRNTTVSSGARKSPVASMTGIMYAGPGCRVSSPYPVTSPSISSTALRRGDAVEKQHHLGAFAQHRDRHHDGERQQRFGAGGNRLAGRAQLGDKLAAVPRHPDIVPGQHQHREAENAGVEHFLAAAAEQFGQAAGEQRHQAGAEYAGGDAAGDPVTAPHHSRGHSHDDADDQAGLENLAKDDQQRG